VTLKREAAVTGTLLSLTDACVKITIGSPSLRSLLKYSPILSDYGDGSIHERTIESDEVVEQNGVALALSQSQAFGQPDNSNNINSIRRHNTWNFY
jgi:hypothetical protein